MKSIQSLGAIAVAGVALAVTSCATGGRSPSGFLTNFSQLDGGYGTADAVAAYADPSANLKKYDSVMIDPVTTVVANPEISAEVTDQLAAYLSDSLRRNVSGGVKLVNRPGPTTLRVRAALTDVIAGRESAAPVTVVHANPKAVLTGKLGSETVAAFFSKVSFEGEIVDSVTGKRISALADQRLGSKREATAAMSWASVRSATEQGAARLWKRFADARAR